MYNKMKIVSLIILFFIFSAVQAQTNQTCHYSCQQCTRPFHQYCKSCHQGYDLLIVKNPEQIPVQLRDTRIVTGICVNSSQFSGVNVLGIVIIIIAVIFITITRSKLLFYITSTMQSLSLLYLLELRWLNPVSYILNSWQYLSPCNTIMRDTKQNTWQITRYNFYYVNQLYGQPQLQKSFSLLGILLIIVIVLLTALHIIKIIKRKYYADSCRQIICISSWAIDYEISFLNCFYFFLIQQTILSFVVGLQFSMINEFLIACIVIYTITTILYLIQLLKFKISMFYNILTQYYEIAKKIIYPIFIIIPFEYQYFLIILMGINCVLQGFFDYKVKSYLLKSRNLLFKILQLITVLFFGIFYAVDTQTTNPKSAESMSIGLTVMLCLVIAFFVVEIVLSTKQKIKSIKQSKEKAAKQSNQSQVMVPQISVLDRDHNNTLGLVSTKRQQRRQTTQAQFVQRQNNNNDKKLSQSFQDPPQYDRDNTKDSFEKSKSDKQKLAVEHIQEISQIQNKEESHEKLSKIKPGEVQKIHVKKKKNNEQFKNELKKRYGV